MAKLPAEFLQQLRDIPILEVAEHYFDIKKIGNVYQTTCIHEGDRSPSLTFFPPTNTFHCFGCGAGKKPVTEGSDVISFVMWLDNSTFHEAVEKLAQQQGIPVPQTEMTEADRKRKQVLDAYLKRNQQYWTALQAQPQALQYLNARGIDREDINKWRIGFVDDIGAHKGKIAFALLNESGNTVGFSYRDMTQEFTGTDRTGPKYINSPKSEVFDKGSILYGLNFVKREIREAGYVVIGEGFGDAIIAQKMDLPFVSLMGTSLTTAHIAALKRYTSTVILWLDGDRAGTEASMRHAKALRKEGFLVKVMNFPGEDPDETLLHILTQYPEEHEEAVTKLVTKEPVLASHFEVEQVLAYYESAHAELKLAVVKEVEAIIEDISSVPERTFTRRMAAERLRVTPEELGWMER